MGWSLVTKVACGRLSNPAAHLSDVPCPLPRRIERVLLSIASPLTRIIWVLQRKLYREAKDELTLRDDACGQ
jgi:hypothetical protein